MATINQKWFRLLGWNVQGDLGPLTMYTSQRHDLVWFLKMPPLNPPTFQQLEQRAKFTLAAATWSDLTEEQKADWERVTIDARLRIHGYNLWTYYSMTKDRATIATLERATGITLLP